MNVTYMMLALATVGVTQDAIASASNTGRINFYGAVVQETCLLDQQPSKLQVSCGSGQQHQMTEFRLTTLDVKSPPSSNTYTVSKQWINKDKGEVVVTVEYR
ncbi:hypothetical protein CK910_22855 [Aeromonas sp. CA23]|uniref:hypothetical protein n=1 Tax=Aeromonas sp. CA23 TaxID=2033032 RepID=UPI000BFC0F06|nr:hypothetical protein [Aeromonas sp. CA23]ATM01001.1 hypothetical protein CK910_22855 [Aeromonas sp. CA23]